MYSHPSNEPNSPIYDQEKEESLMEWIYEQLPTESKEVTIIKEMNANNETLEEELYNVHIELNGFDKDQTGITFYEDKIKVFVDGEIKLERFIDDWDFGIRKNMFTLTGIKAIVELYS